MKKSGGLKRTGTLKKGGGLKKVSEKKKREDPQVKLDRQNKDKTFYKEVWDSRERKCAICGVPFFTESPMSYNCDHIIEKSIRSDLRYEPENIVLVCLSCHFRKNSGIIVPKYKEIIDRAKEKFKIDKSVKDSTKS